MNSDSNCSSYSFVSGDSEFFFKILSEAMDDIIVYCRRIAFLSIHLQNPYLSVIPEVGYTPVCKIENSDEANYEILVIIALVVVPVSMGYTNFFFY